MDRLLSALGIATVAIGFAIALGRPIGPTAAERRLRRFGATPPLPAWAGRAVDRSRRATVVGMAVGAAASVVLALAWPALLRQPHGTVLGQLWLLPTTVAAAIAARTTLVDVLDGRRGAPPIDRLHVVAEPGPAEGTDRSTDRALDGSGAMELVDPRLRHVGGGLVAGTVVLGAAALAIGPRPTGSAIASIIGALVALGAMGVSRSPARPHRPSTTLALAVGADAAHRATGAGIALAGASFAVAVRALGAGTGPLAASTAVSLAALGAWWWASSRARWTPPPTGDRGEPLP